MINSYSQFFAGTYFYLLKVENRGKMSDHSYFAVSASLLIGLSEVALLWGLSFIWFEGSWLSNKGLLLGIGAALVTVNVFLFCGQSRYLSIIKGYREQRRRLTWIAIAIHAMAWGTVFVPAIVKYAHMP